MFNFHRTRNKGLTFLLFAALGANATWQLQDQVSMIEMSSRGAPVQSGQVQPQPHPLPPVPGGPAPITAAPRAAQPPNAAARTLTQPWPDSHRRTHQRPVPSDPCRTNRIYGVDIEKYKMNFVPKPIPRNNGGGNSCYLEATTANLKISTGEYRKLRERCVGTRSCQGVRFNSGNVWVPVGDHDEVERSFTELLSHVDAIRGTKRSRTRIRVSSRVSIGSRHRDSHHRDRYYRDSESGLPSDPSTTEIVQFRDKFFRECGSDAENSFVGAECALSRVSAYTQELRDRGVRGMRIRSEKKNVYNRYVKKGVRKILNRTNEGELATNIGIAEDFIQQLKDIGAPSEDIRQLNRKVGKMKKRHKQKVKREARKRNRDDKKRRKKRRRKEFEEDFQDASTRGKMRMLQRLKYQDPQFYQKMLQMLGLAGPNGWGQNGLNSMMHPSLMCRGGFCMQNQNFMNSAFTNGRCFGGSGMYGSAAIMPMSMGCRSGIGGMSFLSRMSNPYSPLRIPAFGFSNRYRMPRYNMSMMGGGYLGNTGAGYRNYGSRYIMPRGYPYQRPYTAMSQHAGVGANLKLGPLQLGVGAGIHNQYYRGTF